MARVIHYSVDMFEVQSDQRTYAVGKMYWTHISTIEKLY